MDEKLDLESIKIYPRDMKPEKRKEMFKMLKKLDIPYLYEAY
mgnify:CR=1 FL=1